MMRGLCHTLPGTTFSNILQKGDYESEDLAVVDEDDAHWIIHRYICDYYHQKQNRNLGASPQQMWDELTAIPENRPVPPARVDDIKLMAYSMRYCELTREGVTFEGLTYCDKSQALYDLANRGDKPSLVKVRFNSEDMSRVFIEDWRTKKLLEVQSVCLDYTNNLSFAAHLVNRDEALKKKKVKQNLSIENLMEAKHAIREKIKSLVKRKKSTKRWQGTYGKDVIPAVVEDIRAEERAKRRGESRPEAENVVDLPINLKSGKRKKTPEEVAATQAEVKKSMVAAAIAATATARRNTGRVMADF
jgi:putative transposase